MTADERARWDALRRPLSFAARDGFAHLHKVRDLGPTLRGAVDRLLERLVPSDRTAIAAFRQSLDAFERLPTPDQELLIARGLRLVAKDAPSQTLVAPVARGEPKAARERAPRGEPKPDVPRF